MKKLIHHSSSNEWWGITRYDDETTPARNQPRSVLFGPESDHIKREHCAKLTAEADVLAPVLVFWLVVLELDDGEHRVGLVLVEGGLVVLSVVVGDHRDLRGERVIPERTRGGDALTGMNLLC